MIVLKKPKIKKCFHTIIIDDEFSNFEIKKKSKSNIFDEKSSFNLKFDFTRV